MATEQILVRGKLFFLKEVQNGREKKEEFKELAKPLIKFLNEGLSPHYTIIITPTTAELLVGLAVLHTNEFVKD